MLTSLQLSECRNMDIRKCDPETLVDLRDIEIDSALPVFDRVSSFLHQIRNPYLFKVDDTVVKVQYGTGKCLSDALVTILSME